MRIFESCVKVTQILISMRYTLILLFLFTITDSFSQKTDSIYPVRDGIINYYEVVKVDSTNKNQLYINAKKWIANSYKSAKNVIQLDDKESGEIILKGNSDVSYDNALGMTIIVNVNHVFKISVRDNKYKYEFTDFSIDRTEALYDDFLKNNQPQFHKRAVRKFREAFDKQIKLYILDFKTAMLKKDLDDGF